MQRVLEPEVMDTEEDALEYEAMDHAAANAAFVERLLSLGAKGHMLDIGTGPGAIPLLVVERDPLARVTGVDLSHHMLARAEVARRASPHAARLAFRPADAKGLDVPDGSFDAVFSNTILHHIPDPAPFLREAARALAPGGVLLVRDLYRPPSPERVAALVAQHAAGASPQQAELFRASLCAALTPDELRAVADAAGLAHAALTIDSDRHMSLQVPAAR